MSTIKPRTVLIAGGSGFIGTALSKHLKENGFRVLQLTRKPSHPDHIFWDPQNKQINAEQLHQVDVLINLVGENIGSKRWTNARKTEIVSSRVQSTAFLSSIVTQMCSLSYYIGASGVNCYQNQNGVIYNEAAPYGNDFLATVVKDWEAAHELVLKQVPGSIMRISMVLSGHGGSLQLMKLPISLGLGSPIGTGEQTNPWIHLDDLCSLLLFAIEHKLQGTFNALGNCNTNTEMTKLLAKWLRRPLLLPKIPAFMLRLLLGERAVLVLSDLRASNQKVKETGFSFQYTGLDSALASFFTKG